MDRCDSMQGLLIDLFCGAGGVSRGFAEAGWYPAAGVELEDAAADSYAENFPGAVLFREDIRSLSGQALMEELPHSVPAPVCVAGCPPCQGFSTHRLKNSGRDDPRNSLLREFLRVVSEISPDFVLFENVPGLIRNSEVLHSELIQALETNYSVTSSVYNAADFGTPQIRRRLVVLGVKKSSAVMTNLPPCFSASGIVGPPWRTVRDAFAALLTDDSNGYDTLLDRVPHHSKEIVNLIRHIPKDGGSRDALPPHLVLPCHRTHTGHKDVYGRLAWDKPAGTITGGCTQPSRGRFIHPDEDRGLTLREAATLQGFPPHHRFCGTKQQVALQIGNSVPPPLAMAVARHFAEMHRERRDVEGDFISEVA